MNAQDSVQAISLGVEADFIKRNMNEDIRAGLASLAEETLGKMKEISSQAVKKAEQLFPDATWNEPPLDSLLVILEGFLRGEGYIPPDENK